MSMASPDDRRRELAMIHIGAKQLGMDPSDKDPTTPYRLMLWSIGRVQSSGSLNAEGRRQVLAHLKACGFKPKHSVRAPHSSEPTAHSSWDWVNNAAPDRRPTLRKIAMMLQSAARQKPYADGVAKKMYGIERVEFCAPDQLVRIVAALEYDRRRREARK